MAQLLTIKDVSGITQLAVKTLYTMCSQRTIPFMKLGGSVRFDPVELQAWITAQKVQPREQHDWR